VRRAGAAVQQSYTDNLTTSATRLGHVQDPSHTRQDLSADTSPQAEAEACLRTAIDIARQQHAKSWELRAAISLARLWQHEGRRTEARELLAPIYGWFTEGFETADFQDAKALLEELAG